eukprot:GHVT01090930.1.p1 GENE.GHVT01090930.1~~GHVT01090930.1.p1  ORF type:complete len:413 (+),score=83.53 GHVT01090930.1:142-1239(+)
MSAPVGLRAPRAVTPRPLSLFLSAATSRLAGVDAGHPVPTVSPSGVQGFPTSFASPCFFPCAGNRLPFLHLIVASTPTNGIGAEGGLPWPKLGGDLTHFQRVTKAAPPGKKNAIIMGRKTFESIKSRPLPNRINVVLTKQSDKIQAKGVLVATSFDAAIKMLAGDDSIPLHDIFAVGGRGVYSEALQTGLVRYLFVTRIGLDFRCDSFWPGVPSSPPSDSSSSSKPSSSASTSPYSAPPSTPWPYGSSYKVVAMSACHNDQGVPYDFVIYERFEDPDLEKEDQEAPSRERQETNKWWLRSEEQQLHELCGGHEEPSKTKGNSEDGKQLVDPVATIKLRRHPELQYIDLIADIINRGSKAMDRTRR